jgi:DNA-binding transcriptional ArsR family regulator
MKEIPDIARIASLIGDPARANMLNALMSGKALTATELAEEANVTIQTASSHLKQLKDGGLLKLRQQGRHRYFSLANEDVAHVLESLTGLAMGAGHTRIRTGPRNSELRKARVCYNHLAGEMGIRLYDSLMERQLLHFSKSGLSLTPKGESFIAELGIDLTALQRKKSPVCKECLDWSERRSHLAGSLGRELLNHFETLGWAKRIAQTRIIQFTKLGETNFNRLFPRHTR